MPRTRRYTFRVTRVIEETYDVEDTNPTTAAMRLPDLITQGEPESRIETSVKITRVRVSD